MVFLWYILTSNIWYYLSDTQHTTWALFWIDIGKYYTAGGYGTVWLQILSYHKMTKPDIFCLVDRNTNHYLMIFLVTIHQSSTPRHRAAPTTSSTMPPEASSSSPSSSSSSSSLSPYPTWRASWAPRARTWWPRPSRCWARWSRPGPRGRAAPAARGTCCKHGDLWGLLGIRVLNSAVNLLQSNKTLC